MQTLGENTEAHSEDRKEALALAHEKHELALRVLDGAPKL